MGRPSNLTEAQWGEVLRLAASGESVTALARRFKVSKSAISKKVSKQVEGVKTLARSIATVESEFEALPKSQQVAARSLADQLKSIGTNLARAATAGSATAARLAELAQEEANTPLRMADGRVDGGKVLGIVALSEAANKAAAPALKLVTSSPEKGDDARTLEDLVAGVGDE